MRTEQRNFRGDDPEDVKQLLQQTTTGTEAPEVDDILEQLDQAVEELKEEPEEENIAQKFLKMDSIDKLFTAVTHRLPEEIAREIRMKEAEGYVYQCGCGVGKYLCPSGKWVKK